MFTAAVLTVSDKCSRGEREDAAGPLVREMLQKEGYDVQAVCIVPDEKKQIEAALLRYAEEGIALVLTTGGTGFSVRDVTPEATTSICERMAPGISEAMRAACMPITNRAMLSRGVSGIRGRTLFVNLPGSPKAVEENLAPVLSALEHGLHMLLGTKNECAAQTKE